MHDRVRAVSLALDNQLLHVDDIARLAATCAGCRDQIRERLTRLAGRARDRDAASWIGMLAAVTAGWHPERVVRVLREVLHPLIRDRNAMRRYRPWFANFATGSETSETDEDDAGDGSLADHGALAPTAFHAYYWDANILARVGRGWAPRQAAHAFRTIWPFMLVTRSGRGRASLRQQDFSTLERHVMVSLLGPTGLRYAGREAARFLLEFWRGRPEFRAAHRADAVIWQVARSLYACFGPWHEPPRGARVGDGGLRARLPRRRLPVLRASDPDDDGRQRGRPPAGTTASDARAALATRRPVLRVVPGVLARRLAHAASLFVETSRPAGPAAGVSSGGGARPRAPASRSGRGRSDTGRVPAVPRASRRGGRATSRPLGLETFEIPQIPFQNGIWLSCVKKQEKGDLLEQVAWVPSSLLVRRRRGDATPPEGRRAARNRTRLCRVLNSSSSHQRPPATLADPLAETTTVAT